jgi:hypothetical protein
MFDRLHRRLVCDEARLKLLAAAKVRHARRNLDAAEIDTTKANPVVGRSRPEGERDFLTRVESDACAGDGSTKCALRG